MPAPAKQAVLIAGPTASGKSALAVAVARSVGGVVINADSMQVYRDLAVLTARPTADDMDGVPHRLYGHVDAGHAYSVGQYVDEVRAALQAAWADGAVAVLVGGTGLYFTAIEQGLSPIPSIPEAIRQGWRARANAAAPGDLHRVLTERDPVMAARLEPADRQRVVRALEVLEATGQSLSAWQTLKGESLLDGAIVARVVLDWPRPQLVVRADARFQAMMAHGAMDEVRALAGRNLDPSLPAMRALGVRPLMAHLAGTISRDDAVTQAQRETRQYIKRQLTWLRGHMMSWSWLPISENDQELADRAQFVRERLTHA